MPPKSSTTAKKARKSTAPATSGSASKPTSRASTKLASKEIRITVETESSDDENAAPARRSRRDKTEDEDDEENDELKSNPSDSDEVAEELTSASAKKRKAASASPRKTTSSKTAGRQSLKGPSSTSKAIKGGSRPSSKAAAAAPSPKKKASSSAKDSKSAKRKRTTTSTSDNDDSDDESVPTTRSRSARGYTWEAEMINIDPESIMERLVYHGSIKTDIDADYDHEPGEDKVRFKRDQIIYILPDPATLPGRSEEIGPEDLPDDEFWCARILDCCALDQGRNEPPLGLLRVAWFYSADQARRLDLLVNDYKKIIDKHRFAEHEMIASDHVDFVGVDSFCGYPEGRIEYHSMIQGLFVNDVERMKKPALRAKSERVKRLIGLNKKGEVTNANIDRFLDKLARETDEEREKRRAKEAKKAARRKAERAAERDAKRRKSQTRAAASDEEDTDEE